MIIKIGAFGGHSFVLWASIVNPFSTLVLYLKINTHSSEWSSTLQETSSFEPPKLKKNYPTVIVKFPFLEISNISIFWYHTWNNVNCFNLMLEALQLTIGRIVNSSWKQLTLYTVFQFFTSFAWVILHISVVHINYYQEKIQLLLHPTIPNKIISRHFLFTNFNYVDLKLTRHFSQYSPPKCLLHSHFPQLHVPCPLHSSLLSLLKQFSCSKK